MTTTTKAKETMFDDLDERMKRELAAHDQWVEKCEQQWRNQSEADDEPHGKQVPGNSSLERLRCGRSNK